MAKIGEDRHELLPHFSPLKRGASRRLLRGEVNLDINNAVFPHALLRSNSTAK